MLERTRRVLSAPDFPQDEDKTRAARLLNGLLWAAMAVAVAVSVVPGSRMWPVGAVSAVVLLGLRVLLGLGHVRAASLGFLCAAWASATYLTYAWGSVRSSVVIGYFLVIAVACLLLGEGAAIAFGALSAAGAVGAFYAETSGYLTYSAATRSRWWDLVVMLVALGLAMLALWTAARRSSRAFERARQSERALEERTGDLEEVRTSLEQRIEGRTRGLRTAAEVSGAISSTLDPDELLPQVVELVCNRFGLYYAGLFLVDDRREYAVLRAGTGEVGRRMLAEGWKLPIGGHSMIGLCIATGQPGVQLDVGEAAVRFDNPALPETRSELALPLRSRGEVIGAMTVQSVEEAAFDDVYVAVLQAMADQIGDAIANAELYAEAQAALAEVRATQRRYLARAWTDYIRAAETTHYETELPGEPPLADSVVLEIQQAIEQKGVTIVADHQTADQRRSALVAPITFRGQVIGALGVHDEGGGRQWTAKDISLVEAVIERMAATADSLRLLDWTLQREAHERMITEIAGRIRESLDTETMLKTAVDEIQRALGLERILVRLATADPAEDLS